MYLDSFCFPIEEEDEIIGRKASENGGRAPYIDNCYPCYVLSNNRFYEINFEKITILYGGNGSGKSTALNLIAEKLKLERTSPFNKGETFDLYVDACSYKNSYDDYGKIQKIPKGSRIITSDDVFDYMLSIRSTNEEIEEKKENAKSFWTEVRSGKYNREEHILENFERYKNTLLARNKNVNRRQFIRKTAGRELQMHSNGETALAYFDNMLENDKLYCLDEPENSLSPKLQIELVKLLETLSRYCGCQLIIATHSPFIMSISGARIYDMDENPVDIKNWWELENVRSYYDFFDKHREKFASYTPKKKEIIEEGPNYRKPLGVGWMKENRNNLYELIYSKETNYSIITINKVREHIDNSPPLKKDEIAGEILKLIKDGCTEIELRDYLEEKQENN
ncbi:MAG: AAA family ATPase [Parasporobacterium sp.]|nr:AAA family ATPase [Parasporobacterium sp.]